MKKGDNNLINSTNRTNVINVLWREKEITKAQIAESTDLSVPTVMKIINDLAGTRQGEFKRRKTPGDFGTE